VLFASEIYTLKEGQSPKVKITIKMMVQCREKRTIAGSISVCAKSERKEIAIVSRGEILLPMPMVEVPKNHQHTRKSATCNGHQTIKR
jgi:hypothetical protein